MKKRHFPQQSTAGFTILEVLVVVVIIGILTAIAAPGWVSFMNRQRAISAKDQVLQSVRSSQAEAKRRRRRQPIELLPAATENDLPELNMNGRVEVLGQGEIVPGNIQLTTEDNQGNNFNALVFREDGTVSIDGNDYADFGGAAPELPVMITVEAPPNSGRKQCVIIDTILGSIRSESNDDCEIPD
ncbi:MAG: prepilin-type N-terminal cleavage/methylation domain-containing protein [Elainellaceae cyanobacterium]